jgi:type III secretion protein J
MARAALLPIIAALLLAPAACASPDSLGAPPPSSLERDDPHGSPLLPSPDAERLERERTLARDLARTIEELPGVETARVHLSLADRSILSPDRTAASTAALIVRRSGGAAPTAARLRAIAAAAVPGLEAAKVRVFLSDAGAAPVKTVLVGPIEVAASSAWTARACLGGLLVACAVLAAALVWAGLRLRRSRIR